MRNVREYSRLSRAVEGKKNSRPTKARRWTRRFNAILNRINLETYIGWMNRNDTEADSGLIEDLTHWAEYGITSALGLARYLDACVEKDAL